MTVTFAHKRIRVSLSLLKLLLTEYCLALIRAGWLSEASVLSHSTKQSNI